MIQIVDIRIIGFEERRWCRFAVLCNLPYFTIIRVWAYQIWFILSFGVVKLMIVWKFDH